VLRRGPEWGSSGGTGAGSAPAPVNLLQVVEIRSSGMAGAHRLIVGYPTR
jgi:hypothetical protein